MASKPRSYTCAACGGTFETAWSDEEAAAESREAFGVDPAQDPTMAIACDSCYKALTTAIPPKPRMAKHGLARWFRC